MTRTRLVKYPNSGLVGDGQRAMYMGRNGAGNAAGVVVSVSSLVVRLDVMNARRLCTGACWIEVPRDSRTLEALAEVLLDAARDARRV